MVLFGWKVINNLRIMCLVLYFSNYLARESLMLRLATDFTDID